MQRYFFHIHNGIGFLPDKEGVVLSDLDNARSQAIISIRSILAEEIRMTGLIDLGGRIDIEDDGGVTTVVPFCDAVEVRGGAQ
ncbi:hypothetical protein V6R86_01450 [Sphingomonas kaistensis]|uniref:DUF6894 domain-containing protein n=1 Tax=Sphingomonas kaistensis TaxID=298708 RepID=A0ABZ2FZT0_9SPHN